MSVNGSGFASISNDRRVLNNIQIFRTHKHHIILHHRRRNAQFDTRNGACNSYFVRGAFKLVGIMERVLKEVYYVWPHSYKVYHKQ